ncbi:MAG: hypothetical protein JNL97_17880 [Verrucomicrobiales bacterium]|nr:hypothetical protein [Verrucomicrobiales bacterium]
MHLPADNDVALRNAKGDVVTAKLLTELEPGHLSDLRSRWKPELDRLGAPDAHWDWEALYREARVRSHEYRFWALVVDTSVHGVMRVNLMHRTRADPSRHLVYVDRIASAPENRPPYSRFSLRPIGSVLFRQAVLESIDNESYGRVGLHALPSAASWYRDKLGMVSYGIDADHEGLEYFENTNRLALDFLGADAVRALEARGIPVREPVPTSPITAESLRSWVRDVDAFLDSLVRSPEPLWQLLRDCLQPATAKLLETQAAGMASNGLASEVFRELAANFKEARKSPLQALFSESNTPGETVFVLEARRRLAEQYPKLFAPPEPPHRDSTGPTTQEETE